MYNRSLLYVLICFCIDHQKHIIYFPFYFFPRHFFFFFFFFLFFCLFFSIIFISCNFAKHTPWQYLRLTAMDDQAKAIHAYLQISFVIYSFFFSLFYFYFYRDDTIFFFYISHSLCLSLILLSWILTTRILHLVALSTHVCIKIYYYNEANVRLAFYFFVVTYLYIFLCTFTERYMSKKMDQYELYVLYVCRWITGHTVL